MSQAVSALFAILDTVPPVPITAPSEAAIEGYIAVIDPLIRSCCSLRVCVTASSYTELPSHYYESITPNQQVYEIGQKLDVPSVLGQAVFLSFLWTCTRVADPRAFHW